MALEPSDRFQSQPLARATCFRLAFGFRPAFLERACCCVGCPPPEIAIKCSRWLISGTAHGRALGLRFDPIRNPARKFFSEASADFSASFVWNEHVARPAGSARLVSNSYFDSERGIYPASRSATLNAFGLFPAPLAVAS